jgi:amphi-Trp domain-containing protein
MSGRKDTLVRSEEWKSRQGVADFLHQLADKIGEGEVVLRRGADEIRLNLPETVELEIEVQEKVKKGRTERELEIEIEWEVGGSDEPVTLG